MAVLAIVIAGVVAIAALALSLAPISVTVNGTQVELGPDRTIAAAVSEAGIEVSPGDLESVDGSVLEKGQGEPFHAVVNDQDADPSGSLRNGDVVIVSDGNDITEDYDVRYEPLPYTTTIEGMGSIHAIEGQGEDGEQEVHVGKVSGETAVAKVTKEPSDIVCVRSNPDVHGEKVIALTFDDGPLNEYTEPILDILEENDAKATFFMVGTNVNDATLPLIERAHEEGHQVCTHSWSHASGSGKGADLGLMSPDEQVDEISKGQEVLADAIGEDASKVVRFPGGNLDEALVTNVSPYVTYEIGWSIDSYDWQKPGADAICSQIVSAQPGDIILMHDGGGDRSQTVQGLRQALPQLRKDGYRFVTVDELLEMAS